MTTRALAMPEFVARLVRLQLARMGLDASDATDDIVTCPLDYENSAALTLVVMCVAKRGWFNRLKLLLSVSIVELDGQTRAVRVHSRDTMALPTGPDDLPFTLRLAARVQASAWMLTKTGNMGVCLNLPGKSPP